MKKKKNTGEILEALAMVTQIGLAMITAMAISLFIGYWLDRLFGTRFCIIIMMFIGIAAAIRSMLVITKRFFPEHKENLDKTNKKE